MAFSPRFLDELRNRVSVTDVVGKRVALTRKGRELWGLCPFHKEKSPSFSVSDEKGFYHCFGCGAHGSAIDFVMETDKLSFPEAVERLAHDTGLEIPVESPEERERAKKADTLYDVMTKAATYFGQQLRMPAGREALQYLLGRGLSEETIKRFGLGFAPAERGGLKAALSREGVSEELMISAGLLISPEDGNRDSYDRFRGRVMFPITDRRRRVIAFGGRIIGQGEPKYLNSPETPLFHKGRTLYGLPEALESIRKIGSVLVTEGYMDVIALSQAGFTNAVAPLGTALTEDQIALLWKAAPEPVLCFDGDSAGQRAAMRAAERSLPLLRPGVSLRFALLPEGEDPDSLITNKGTAAMRGVIEEARSLSDVLWHSVVGAAVPAAPEVKAKAWQDLKTQTARIADETVRRSYEESFRDRFWARGGGWAGGKRGKGGAALPAAALGKGGGAVRIDQERLREQILLAVLLTHPALFDRIDERLGSLSFSAPDLDKLRQELLKTLSGDPDLDFKALEAHLRRCGFSEPVDGLLLGGVFDHAYFARPEQSPDSALEGWEQTYTLYKRKGLKAEIQEARRAFEAEGTEEAYRKWQVLKDFELHQLDDGGEAA
ncbi:MAG: DNA primase [Rhodospirillales bacterium]|nr:DNA primase [Rhodospirillales bacterium]MCW8861830.1 DNA primase [Rhodospirillales bacterium]MCW8951113.1 DNA primase [Rhodospirillales bacterium]MCW8970536.1 DNA primase [Rhodospirillales bacterium]MCW9002375.1 DNA primase [Rhodospirillales bacterium]